MAYLVSRSSSGLQRASHFSICMAHPASVATRLLRKHRAHLSLSAPHHDVLEVERKFAPTLASLHLLDTNSGSPPFRSLLSNGTSNIEDTYYDTKEKTLMTDGVYLRHRNGKWEAKVRVGGDFVNSAFKEVTDISAISAILNMYLPGTGLAQAGPTGNQSVQPVAKFVTMRTKFVVDSRFTVVIDKTDFGHVVGEVELEHRIAKVETREDQNHDKLVDMMEHEIDDFMKQYAWAFPPDRPLGKLSAYFSQSRKDRHV